VHDTRTVVSSFSLLVQLVMLAVLLLTAFLAGTLLAGANASPPTRAALGLAGCAHALLFLALAGQLRPIPILALTVLAIAGGVWRMRRRPGEVMPLAPERWPRAVAVAFAAAGALLFVLTLLPPVAFDETLYHLPFVHDFAAGGTLRFVPHFRFPVFPALQELLAVPLYLAGGDAAAHLVAFAELVVLLALLMEWGRRYAPGAGLLAAALFAGSPLVIHLASILYVELGVTLFVVAGFYALDRERYSLAGVFFGTACGVKYLGFYFAAVAVLIVFVRRTGIVRFLVALSATALPMTLWITVHTGNPVFPFLLDNAWQLGVREPVGVVERVTGLLRLGWDVTFERGRVGMQPPVTPFLALIVAGVAAGAVRHTRARQLVAIGLVFLAAFSFLPQDVRYLVPLLALSSLCAAIVAAARFPRAVTALAVLALLPGLAYAVYRIHRWGPPPAAPAQKREWLSRRVPTYRALLRSGDERLYVCGAENLKAYKPVGMVLGDFNGPHSYERILGDGTAIAAERLRDRRVPFLLFAKGKCPYPQPDAGMTLVYEDEAAQLWRIPGVTDAESRTHPSRRTSHGIAPPSP
jgi:hypothetical protein